MMYLGHDLLLLVLLITTAVYTHFQLSWHVADRVKARAARRFFTTAGIAAAAVFCVIVMPEKPQEWVLSLTLGFCLVHVPAGLTLYFKRRLRPGLAA